MEEGRSMKQQISPVMAAIVILLIVGVAAFALVRSGSVSRNPQAPPAMPEIAQQQWQAIAGSAAPGKGGSTRENGNGTIPGAGQMPTGMSSGNSPGVGMTLPGVSPR